MMAPKIQKEQKLIGEDGAQPINTARFTADGALADLPALELKWCDKLGRPRVGAANYEPLLVPDFGAGNSACFGAVTAQVSSRHQIQLVTQRPTWQGALSMPQLKFAAAAHGTWWR